MWCVNGSLSGGLPEEVGEIKGNLTITDDEKFQYYGTVSQILKQVGMKPKVIVESSQAEQAEIDKQGENVLGHIWKLIEDKPVSPWEEMWC